MLNKVKRLLYRFFADAQNDRQCKHVCHYHKKRVAPYGTTLFYDYKEPLKGYFLMKVC